MKKFQIVLGSDEGHCINESFVFKSNKNIEEIREAYEKSCNLTDIQFDGESVKTKSKKVIFGDFQEREIYRKDIDLLKSHGIPESVFPRDNGNSDRIYFQDYEAIDLIIEFIKLSLPDWEVKESSKKRSESVPVLEDRMGYGLYG